MLTSFMPRPWKWPVTREVVDAERARRVLRAATEERDDDNEKSAQGLELIGLRRT